MCAPLSKSWSAHLVVSKPSPQRLQGQRNVELDIVTILRRKLYALEHRVIPEGAFLRWTQIEEVDALPRQIKLKPDEPTRDFFGVRRRIDNFDTLRPHAGVDGKHVDRFFVTEQQQV